MVACVLSPRSYSPPLRSSCDVTLSPVNLFLARVVPFLLYGAMVSARCCAVIHADNAYNDNRVPTRGSDRGQRLPTTHIAFDMPPVAARCCLACLPMLLRSYDVTPAFAVSPLPHLNRVASSSPFSPVCLISLLPLLTCSASLIATPAFCRLCRHAA